MSEGSEREGTTEIQRLLRNALEEEERRLVALEKRVQSLSDRPDPSLPALPPAGGLEEPPVDPGPINFSDTADWRNPPATPMTELSEPRPSGFTGVEPLEPPPAALTRDTPPPTTGFAEENERPLAERPTAGFGDADRRQVDTGFREAPESIEPAPIDPTPMRQDVAHLTAPPLTDPTPIEQSEYPTETGYRMPVEILEDPSPSGFHEPVPVAEPIAKPIDTGFRDPPEDPSETLVPLEEPRPRGFPDRDPELGAVPLPTPPAEREFRDPAPVDGVLETPVPRGFQEPGDGFDEGTDKFELFAPPPPEELDAARQLIAESGQHLRELEDKLTELEAGFSEELTELEAGVTEALRVEVPPPEPGEMVEPRPRNFREEESLDPGRFELGRAFGEAGEEVDLQALLDEQQDLRDRVTFLGEQLEVMQDAAAEREAELLGRAERAERACGDALAKLTALTSRTEALTTAVTNLSAQVAQLTKGGLPAPAPDASTTQQLLGLLRSGAAQRPGEESSLTGSGAFARDPLRARLLKTVAEHQRMLRDQGRLLDRLLDED